MKKFYLPLFFVVLLLVSSPAGAAYVNNGDGTVTDTVTGLLWQQADDGVERTWEEALEYCETRTLANRHDWRLPNIRELKSIRDLSRYDPAIDPVFECRSSFTGRVVPSPPVRTARGTCTSTLAATIGTIRVTPFMLGACARDHLGPLVL